MLVNLEAYDGPVVMVSVTPPGVDRLPWDEEHCRHPHGGRHDGKRGCRVQQRAAREWNETAVHRLSMLRRAASQHVRRHVRDADGEPVPVNLLERVWEPQKRGVAHVHLVFGGRTTEELEAVAEFVTKTKALARDYDFGFVDAKGTKRRDDPRSRGRRLTVRGVELKLIPAGEAARYLSSYLCGRSKYKPSIRENAIAPAMVALSGDRLRAHRLPLVWLTPKLTKATLVTMRTLRRARQLYAVFAGRYYDDRGNTAPAWFYELRDVLEAALIFRRTRRRDGKRGDDDAAVAAFVQDTIERVEAMESGWPRLVQYREAMRYVRLIADPPARIVQPRERLLAAAA
jgi:hypothetical protein